MKKYSMILIFTAMIVTGCSTTPVSVGKSQPVPQDRIYEAYKKYSSSKETQANIIIVRDNGVLGVAGTAALFVNGEIVARVRAGESITIHTNGGDNILGVGPGTKMGWEKDNVELIEQTLNAEAGKTYYFRISINFNKGLILQRTSQVL
jgi:hypothetical protein